MSILENNSIFWSRLGFENDPPRYDDNGNLIEFGGDYTKFAQYHKDIYDQGVKLHTSILFNGWVGEDKYDYTLTDRTLDAIFKVLPEDAVYIPRVKLNAPVEWSKLHPEELLVYYGGNNDPEYIRPRVGTLEHDLLGYEAPDGYYMGKDKRPNLNGFFSNQSFASEAWKAAASEALVRLMRHIAAKPYGHRIIGWHIAYGVSGETCLWGRFGREYGDYSRRFHNAFIQWGEKKYGSREKLLEAWGTLEMPSPAMRKNVYDSLDAFMRRRPCDVIVQDLDTYMSELNSSLVEHFCKIVKTESPQAFTGVFYGYILQCLNAAYTGWLNIDRLLNSPYVDFLAAPTSYTRRGAGESGGFIVPAHSVGMKKLWVDELDIRTYLAENVPVDHRVPKEATAAVFFRELSKNLSANAGYWWMDLGGGWYASDYVHQIVRKVEDAAREVRKRPHQSTADVLFVVDEKAFIQHTQAGPLFDLNLDFQREAALAGVIFDLYRLSDLPKLNLDQYKLVVFCDCPAAPPMPADKTVLYSYVDALPEGLAIEEVAGKFPTGKVSFEGIFSGEAELPEMPLPRVSPVVGPGVEVHGRFADGTPAVVSDGKNFYSTLLMLKWKQFRQLCEFAGCRTYGDAPCTAYGDNRFTAVFSHNEPAKYSFQIH